MNEPETIREILENTKTIAVIGLSDKPGRASLGVSRFMQQQGYRIVPINPRATSVLGERAYPTLDEAYREFGEKLDLVNVFRDPAYLPAIVEDVIRLKIRCLWLQEGVCHDEAARSAEAAGVRVVMDHCILKERMAYGWRNPV